MPSENGSELSGVTTPSRLLHRRINDGSSCGKRSIEEPQSWQVPAKDTRRFALTKLDQIEEAISFEVMGGDFYGNGKPTEAWSGVVAVRSQWLQE
jgi:hypothetical protein